MTQFLIWICFEREWGGALYLGELSSVVFTVENVITIEELAGTAGESADISEGPTVLSVEKPIIRNKVD